MKTNKKQVETSLFKLCEENAKLLLDSEKRTLDKCADTVNSLVRHMVNEYVKSAYSKEEASALPLTYVVRLRLESEWDLKYVQIGMLGNRLPVPDAGLIRLGKFDSAFIYNYLRQYSNHWEDTLRTADLAGKAVDMPDFEVHFVEQPGEKPKRYMREHFVYRPMEIGRMTFRKL